MTDKKTEINIDSMSEHADAHWDGVKQRHSQMYTEITRGTRQSLNMAAAVAAIGYGGKFDLDTSLNIVYTPPEAPMEPTDELITSKSFYELFTALTAPGFGVFLARTSPGFDVRAFVQEKEAVRSSATGKVIAPAGTLLSFFFHPWVKSGKVKLVIPAGRRDVDDLFEGLRFVRMGNVPSYFEWPPEPKGDEVAGEAFAVRRPVWGLTQTRKVRENVRFGAFANRQGLSDPGEILKSLAPYFDFPADILQSTNPKVAKLSAPGPVVASLRADRSDLSDGQRSTYPQRFKTLQVAQDFMGNLNKLLAECSYPGAFKMEGAFIVYEPVPEAQALLDARAVKNKDTENHRALFLALAVRVSSWITSQNSFSQGKDSMEHVFMAGRSMGKTTTLTSRFMEVFEALVVLGKEKLYIPLFIHGDVHAVSGKGVAIFEGRGRLRDEYGYMDTMLLLKQQEEERTSDGKYLFASSKHRGEHPNKIDLGFNLDSISSFWEDKEPTQVTPYTEQAAIQDEVSNPEPAVTKPVKGKKGRLDRFIATRELQAQKKREQAAKLLRARKAPGAW